MQAPIKLKRSSEAGKVPTPADLALGELAINTHDGKMFMKKDDGAEAIVPVGGGASLELSASPTAAYTLLASDAGKYVSIEAGGSIVVPPGVFEPGNLIMLFNNTGADATIDTAGLDSYIAGEDGNISSGQIRPRGVVYVYFLSATMCLLFGNIIGPVFVDYLIVAGGGGGSMNAGGGGGAGGLLQGTGLQVERNILHSIAVGAGGAGAYTGSNGGNSSAFGLTAIGGGRGGRYNVSGASGGSGGGAGSGSANGGAGTPGQGNNGGGAPGGGGGGYTSAGTSTTAGDGIQLNFGGLNVAYAGGGKAYDTGVGLGGGSTANRGGGGGGCSGSTCGASSGGSGVVTIVAPRLAAISTVNPTTLNEQFVYRFTGSGSIMF